MVGQRNKPGRNKSEPDRWGSPRSIEDITDDAIRSLRDDDAHLVDFHQLCRRNNYEFFGRMSLAQFKVWAMARLDEIESEDRRRDKAIELELPVMTLCKRIYSGFVYRAGGLTDECADELLACANELTVQMTNGDGTPKYTDEEASRTITEEFQIIVDSHPKRDGLTPKAIKHRAELYPEKA